MTDYAGVKAWRAKNKDKVAAQCKRYKLKHPETSIKASKKYYDIHAEELRKKSRESQMQRRKNNPDGQKLRNLKFKIEQEKKREKIAGRARQQVCELCNEINNNFSCVKYKTLFDHDHITGEFRGWICDRCNKVLGLVDDNPELLIMMSNYLKQGGSNETILRKEKGIKINIIRHAKTEKIPD